MGCSVRKPFQEKNTKDLIDKQLSINIILNPMIIKKQILQYQHDKTTYTITVIPEICTN